MQFRVFGLLFFLVKNCALHLCDLWFVVNGICLIYILFLFHGSDLEFPLDFQVILKVNRVSFWVLFRRRQKIRSSIEISSVIGLIGLVS